MMNNNIEKEEIAAMAIAAIAEELNMDLHKVRIISFYEVEVGSQEDQR